MGAVLLWLKVSVVLLLCCVSLLSAVQCVSVTSPALYWPFDLSTGELSQLRSDSSSLPLVSYPWPRFGNGSLSLQAISKSAGTTNQVPSAALPSALFLSNPQTDSPVMSSTSAVSGGSASSMAFCNFTLSTWLVGSSAASASQQPLTLLTADTVGFAPTSSAHLLWQSTGTALSSLSMSNCSLSFASTGKLNIATSCWSVVHQTGIPLNAGAVGWTHVLVVLQVSANSNINVNNQTHSKLQSSSPSASTATLSTYINGTLAAQQNITLPAAVFPVSSRTNSTTTKTTIIPLPASQFSGGQEQTTSGSMDELMVFTSALSNTSVSTLFQYDRADLTCPPFMTFDTSQLLCSAVDAVITHHWSFDVASTDGSFIDSVKPSAVSAVPTTVNSSALTSSLLGSTSSLVDTGDIGTSVFGFGSAYNFRYLPASTGGLCSVPECVAAAPAWLTVHNASVLADLDQGWSVSFWYQSAVDGLVGAADGAHSANTVQTIISEEQSHTLQWSHRIRLLTSSPNNQRLSYQLQSQLHLKNGTVLTASLGWEQSFDVEGGVTADAGLPWLFFTVSYRVNDITDTLTCTITRGDYTQGDNSSITVTTFDGLTQIQQTITPLDHNATDYGWALLGSAIQDKSSQQTPPAASTTLNSASSIIPSTVHGLVDEVRVTTGPLTSNQVASLNATNSGTGASTGLVMGCSYSFSIQSATSTLAFNTTDMNVNQSSPVLVPSVLDGVTMLPNEAEGAQEVLSGRKVSVSGTITINVLNFTFEAGRLMVGIWPGDVNLQCTDLSFDPTAEGAQEQQAMPSQCQLTNSNLATLPPFYVTQNTSTSLFVNLYLQLSGTADQQYNSIRAVNMIISMLNWYQSDMPGGEGVASTISDGQATSPSYNVGSDTYNSNSSSNNGVNMAAVTTLPFPSQSVLSDSGVAPVTSTYTTTAVHPHAMRRLDRTHTVHYDYARLLASKPPHIRQGLMNALLNTTTAVTTTRTAASLASQTKAVVGPPSSGPGQLPPSPSYCVDVLSTITNDPDNTAANPFDFYNTSVITCYQSGVGPVFSYMSESGQIDNSAPLLPITVAPLTATDTTSPGGNTTTTTNASAMIRSVNAISGASSVGSYLISPAGQTFYVHLAVGNSSDMQADSDFDISASSVNSTGLSVNHSTSTFSLLSSAASEPLVSHANQVVTFTSQLAYSNQQHCVWMVDVWGGMVEWCRDSFAAEVDAGELWADATWSLLTDPASDFQVAQVKVRPVVHPDSYFIGCNLTCAAGIGAVVLDSLGIMHVGRLTYSNWTWSALSISDNQLSYTDFEFYSDAVTDINADGEDDSEDADELLGIAFGSGRLVRVYVRGGTEPTLPGTAETAFLPTSVFPTSGRGEPFPVVGPIIPHSLRSYWNNSVYDFSLPTLAAQSVLQGRGAAYAIMDSHELKYSEWQNSTQTYSTWSSLVDDQVVDVLAYAVTDADRTTVVEGALYVSLSGSLYCVERTVPSTQSGLPLLSLVDGGVTPIDNIIRCVSKKDASKPCSRAELLHHSTIDSVLRLEPVSSQSYDSVAVTPSKPDLAVALMWVFTQRSAVLLQRSTSDEACGWKPTTQLQLQALEHAVDHASTLGAQGVSPVTYTAAVTAESDMASTGTSSTPNMANYVPPQFQSPNGDDTSMEADLVYDVAGDGTQAAYGGSANLTASLTSIVNLTGMIAQRFIPLGAASGTLVPSPVGVHSPAASYQAVSFATVATYLPEPSDLLNATYLQTVLTNLSSNPINLSASALGQYQDFITEYGDSAVSLVHSWVFQGQMQPLSSNVLNNANLTGVMLGIITSMFPPSTYADTILNTLLNSASNPSNTTQLDVMTAALQAAYFIHCPSSALVNATNAFVNPNAVIDTLPSDASSAALSALSIWSSNTDCASNQSAAQAVGLTSSQIQEMAVAQSFYSNITSTVQAPTTTTNTAKSTSTASTITAGATDTIRHALVHRYLLQPCPEILSDIGEDGLDVSNPLPTPGGSNNNNNGSTVTPSCHFNSMRQSLLASVSGATTPQQVSQSMLLLGNTAHEDDAATLLQHAQDDSQDADVRYAALWALRKHSITDDIVTVLMYLQQTSTVDNVRLGALKTLSFVAGQYCSSSSFMKLTRELTWQFYLVVRRPLELKALSMYFDRRSTCGAGDQKMARLAAVRTRHQLQSAYAQNGPYTALTDASHSHFVDTVSKANVSSAGLRTDATASTSSSTASTTVGQDNTVLFYKKNWGAENANLQFNTYGGYTFDSAGFTEEAFMAASVNFYGYNLQFAYADANSYWTSGGLVGYHTQVTIAWLDIYKFSIVPYDVFARYYSFQTGVGITTGNTCTLRPGTALRTAYSDSRTFIKLEYGYGLPYVCWVGVGVSLGGSFTAQYGATVTLPAAQQGQTVTFASFSNASVQGYVVPKASLSGSVYAKARVLNAQGGIQGTLTVIDMSLPFTAGYHIGFNQFGVKSETNTNLLSGEVRLWAEVWYLFDTWSKSWQLFRWPGIRFNQVIFQECYCPSSCGGTSGGTLYYGRRRLLSIVEPEPVVVMLTLGNVSYPVEAAAPMSRKLLQWTYQECVDNPSLCDSDQSRGETVNTWGYACAKTTVWCANDGGTNCRDASQSWCEVYDKTGNWLDARGGDYTTLNAPNSFCGTRWSRSCQAWLQSTFLAVQSNGQIAPTNPFTSNAVMSSTPATLALANQQTVAATTSGTATSTAGAHLAQRSWNLYPYVQSFVLYHKSLLNAYANNGDPFKPTKVFHVSGADGGVDGADDVDDDDWSDSFNSSSSSSSSTGGATGRRLLGVQTCGGSAGSPTSPSAGTACGTTALVVFTYACQSYPQVCWNTICALNYNMASSINNKPVYSKWTGISINTAPYKLSGFSFVPGSSGDRRRESLPSSLPTSTGKDRDEVPMASWSIGGCNARLQAIDPSQNRQHGGQFGGQVRPYGKPQGNPFVPMIIDLSTWQNSYQTDARTCCTNEYQVTERINIQRSANKCDPQVPTKTQIYGAGVC